MRAVSLMFTLVVAAPAAAFEPTANYRRHDLHDRAGLSRYDTVGYWLMHDT